MSETIQTEGSSPQKTENDWTDEYIEYLENVHTLLIHNIEGIISLEDDDILSPVMTKNECRLDLILRAVAGETLYGIN